MTNQQLELDENHIYRFNGEIVPGVNQILEAEGIRPPYGGDPWYGERGTYIHQATALYDRGELDEESLDPQLKGYVEAWKKFREETGFIPLEIEKAVYSQEYGFAGTIDRIGEWPRCGFKILVDIKCGELARWMKIQLAAYSGLLAGQRYAVKLNADGTFASKLYSDPEDIEIFLAALNLYKWKNRFKRSNK